MAFEHGDHHFAPRSKPDVIWSLINFLHKTQKSVYFVVLLIIFQLKKKLKLNRIIEGKPSGGLETGWKLKYLDLKKRPDFR